MNKPAQKFAPVTRETVSAQEFLRLTRGGGRSIKRSRFVPPTLGARGFGRFEVVYSVPVLRTAPT